MGKLKKIFFSFLVLFFMQISYSYQYPNNGWPTSFNYYYGNAENPIENMFNDEKVTKWFNQGYNPDDRYRPINEKFCEDILNELKDVASGFNGGGREAECIVHCLTKRCNNSSHDFSKLTVGGFRGQEIDIACHKIEEKSWKGKKDIADEMEAGDCFCGIKKTEKSVDNFQDFRYTILSCTGYIMTQKRPVNQDVFQVETHDCRQYFSSVSHGFLV